MPGPARNADLRYRWLRYLRLHMEKRQQRHRSEHARERVEPRCYRGEMPIGLRFTLALVLALAATHALAWAQGERDKMQQWIGSYCEANPDNPACHHVKQRVARPGKFHPYPGPIDLCPPSQFRLDPRDGCVEVGLHRVGR